LARCAYRACTPKGGASPYHARLVPETIRAINDARTPPLALRTARLDLVLSTPEMIRAEIAGDHARLSRLLQARIADGWPTEHWDAGAMEWTLRAFEQPHVRRGWGMWYWLAREPAGPPASRVDASLAALQRTLIGAGGFKGAPDANGEVEIGYGVVSEHHRRGYATEASRALLEWALQHEAVRLIAAETYPHLTPSLGVMAKLGMRYRGEGSEPGVVRYGVTREQYVG